MPAIGAISSQRLGRVTLPVLLAILVASCGGQAGASTKSAPSPGAAGTGRATPQPLLEGDGIGSVKFGQPPDVVAARLRRLFGPPVAANKIPNGYVRFRCGFYWEQWNGLGAASNGDLFYARLLVWFMKARFVGYDYADNSMETYYGLGSSDRTQLARRRVMLATAKGLAVGDPLTRGQLLYGRSFVVTAQMQGRPPNLGRFAAWEASTASGRIKGTSDSPVLIEGAINKPSHRVSRHRLSIDGIDAGTNPRTPCHRHRK